MRRPGRRRAGVAAAWCCVAVLFASGSPTLGEPWQLIDDDELTPQELLALLDATRLVEAAAAGDLEAVRSRLDRGTPADHPFEGTDTALHAAVAGGHEDVVALLLDRGADPNRAGNSGRKSLEVAFEADSPVIARRLLDAGARADAGATGGRRQSLLGRAIADRRQEWSDLLIAHDATLGAGEADPLLARALADAAPDRLDRMRLLLDLGADPSYRPDAGIRPLIHVAVLDGALAEMELLIAHGADLEARDGMLGESTLHLAVKTGRTELVERLLALGADPNARSRAGTTPLFPPLALRRDELARRLIEAGARADVASNQGRTPLMELAAWRPPRDARASEDDSLVALIDLLLEHGADLDAVDQRGDSAVSLAGGACNLTALTELARRGARIETEVWIDLLHAPCAPRWAGALDDLRADLGLPLPSLEELSRGPLAPPDPVDLDAQRRTLAEMRDVGTALMSWLTDQVSRLEPVPQVRFAADGARAGTAAGTGIETADGGGTSLANLPAVGAEQLREMLVPLYLRDVPEVDGWGFRYDYRIAGSLLGQGPILVVRSPGSDGRFSGDDYPEPRLTKGLFPPSETHRDIVWIDGRFVQAPRLLPTKSAPAAPPARRTAETQPPPPKPISTRSGSTMEAPPRPRAGAGRPGRVGAAALGRAAA